MNEEILQYEPELTPLQQLRKAESEQISSEKEQANKEAEEELEKTMKSRRDLDEQLPQAQDEAMASVMRAGEASQAKEQAQIAKNMQQAKQRGEDISLLTAGKYRQGNPDDPEDTRCVSCFTRQSELQKYALTNYNSAGDRCRDCGHNLVVFQQELIA